MRTVRGLVALMAVMACGLMALAAETAPASQPAALVVTKAVYGDLPSGASIDVTDKVKALVKEGKLKVEATNDNFTDPAEGIQKKLRVEYTENGAKKVAEVNENETLTLPEAKKE